MAESSARPKQTITFQVSRAQFLSGLAGLAMLIATFGCSMRDDVNEHGTELQQQSARLAIIEDSVKQATLKAEAAKEAYNTINVRLARMETLLEQLAKTLEDQRVKIDRRLERPPMK